MTAASAAVIAAVGIGGAGGAGCSDGGGRTFREGGIVHRGGDNGVDDDGDGLGKKSTSAMHLDPSFSCFDTKKTLLWPIPGRTFSAKSCLQFVLFHVWVGVYY